MEGRYTDGYVQREGASGPHVEAGAMKIIGSPLDFVGLNVYTPEYVRADASPAGYVVEPRPSSFPRMASPWLFIGPEVIHWAVRKGRRVLRASSTNYSRTILLLMSRFSTGICHRLCPEAGNRAIPQQHSQITLAMFQNNSRIGLAIFSRSMNL